MEAVSTAPVAAPTPSDAPEGVPTPALAEATENKAPTDATPKAPEMQRFKVKQKVDGAEVEKEVPLDEMLSTYGQVDQIRTAANKRFQEAAELQKKLQAAVEKIKQDPFSALKDEVFGLDLDSLAEKRLADKYRAELLKKEDPKAYEMWEKEQQLAKREQELQEWQKQREGEAQMALEQREAERTFNTFNSALEKSGLPRDGETIALMAEIALVNLDYGLELTPEQLAQATRDRLEGFSNRSKKRYDSMEGDALLADLGGDVVEKVRKALLAKAKALGTRPAPARPQAEDTKNTEVKGRQYVSDSQMLREIMRG